MMLSDYQDKTILIVDDNQSVLSSFSDALRVAGVKNVKIADNGELAIKICSEIGADLILLDLEMPVLDGWDVLERLKSEGLKPNGFQTKVIIFTVDEDPDSATRSIRAGATDFLLKKNFQSEAETRIRRAFEVGEYVTAVHGRQVLIRYLEDMIASGREKHIDPAMINQVKQVRDSLLAGELEKKKWNWDAVNNVSATVKRGSSVINWIWTNWPF